MKQLITSITIGLFALTSLTGCATTGPDEFNNEQHMEAEKSPSAKKRWLMIGGALLLSAIIVHESEDGTKDAVRNSIGP